MLIENMCFLLLAIITQHSLCLFEYRIHQQKGFIVDQPTHEIKHIQAFSVNAKLLWDIYMSHNGG